MSIQSILAAMFPVASVTVDPLQAWVDKVAQAEANAEKQKLQDEAETALLTREQDLKGKYRAVKSAALVNTKFLKTKKEQLKAAIALEDRLNEFCDFCIDQVEVVPQPEINQNIAKLSDAEFTQWMSVVKQCITEDELLDLIARALV